MTMQVYVACVMLLAGLSVATAATNLRPIIGVLAQETDHSEHGDTYIPWNYFQYIQMAGARAVPIRVKMPMDYYTRMFKSINGILFPGGGVDIVTSEFAKAARVFFKMALEANDAGDYFPVWGTCQGFELLTALVTGKNVLSKYDAEDLPLPLDFAPGYQSSRLYGNLPADVSQYLQYKNVTENFHHYGLAPETYATNNDLNKFFKSLSTNFDRNGKQFISTIEAYKYPVYGVQWHPEKTMFTWSTELHVVHTPEAIRVSHYMGDFLVAEARKSGHSFASQQEEIDALIANYNPVYSRDHDFEQTYYFNYTNDAVTTNL